MTMTMSDFICRVFIIIVAIIIANIIIKNFINIDNNDD